ncbi:MAG: DMT family transporter [Chloroflexota bacterium]
MTVSTVALPKRITTINQGWFLAGFTIIGGSLAPTTTKLIIDAGVDPSLLLMVRYIMTTLLFAGTIAITSPQLLRIDLKGLLVCIVAGILYGSAAFSFTWSLTYIDTSIASITVAAYPLIVLVLLSFRGEPFTKRNAFRLALGFMGIALLVGGPNGSVNMTGILLVLGTCVAFAFYMVAIQWFLKDYNAQTVSFYVIGTVAVYIAGVWWMQSGEWVTPSWQGWLGIGFLAVVSTYLTNLALFVAVRHLGSGQMALLNPIEILLMVVWAFIFLQESLTPIQWAGSGLILGSMVLAMERLGRLRGMPWRARLRLRF